MFGGGAKRCLQVSASWLDDDSDSEEEEEEEEEDIDMSGFTVSTGPTIAEKAAAEAKAAEEAGLDQDSVIALRKVPAASKFSTIAHTFRCSILPPTHHTPPPPTTHTAHTTTHRTPHHTHAM